MCTEYFSERSSVFRAQAPKSYLRRRDLRNPEYGEEREHSLDLEVDAKRLDPELPPRWTPYHLL